MRRTTFGLTPVLVAALWAGGSMAQDERADGEISAERGRYIAEIAGCNDCHTAGYAASGGQVPVADWLLGSEIGFNGPWGTTYPDNLRLHPDKMTEDEWVDAAKEMKTRPPMPWFNVRAMHDGDLRSFYRFVKSLGETGEPAPDFVPPGETPAHPYVVFAPPRTP